MELVRVPQNLWTEAFNRDGLMRVPVDARTVDTSSTGHDRWDMWKSPRSVTVVTEPIPGPRSLVPASSAPSVYRSPSIRLLMTLLKSRSRVRSVSIFRTEWITVE